ncbi:MAG TPA: carboxypeptidase M32 [Ktedonobacterales bacterium]|nr:carboxypeptidase M32 [Ktedonobacterales bacterium]
MVSSNSSAAAGPRFSADDKRITELLTVTHEIADLRAALSLLSWDQNTAMPEGAGEVRGEQLATLQGLIHERWTTQRLGELLSELATPSRSAPFTDADRALVREVTRERTHATRLPRGLVEEMARVEASSFEAWRKARTTNDFALFAPWLARTITLQREVADRLGFKATRYDALLDLYEPGLTSERVDTLFAPVREISVRMRQRIEASGHTIDASSLAGAFPSDQQMRLARDILTRMGYDFARGGLMISPHPFTTDFGSPYDVRVTVHPHEDTLDDALMAALHEGGHALYEQGSAPDLTRTPIVGGVSMGAHESQSRLWENAIGRSEAFWRGNLDTVRTVFPKAFTSVDAATFSRALNKVTPGLIRIAADEVTYNLHIIIRYEMEQAMVNTSVAVESLPRMWNEKYQAYLGITPPTDSDGILQDVHWTSGFGYFPTYTLGNLYAAQIYAAMRESFADFDERLARGDSAFALDWLRERMYRWGKTYLPEDLIERVTGKRPDPSYFVEYLTRKFEQVYDLPAE